MTADHEHDNGAIGNSCPLCDEPVTAEQSADPGAQRLDGLGGYRVAHRECLLRDVMGGIGHLENHAFWCIEADDPDAGRTLRQSAIEVDEWVRTRGSRAT